MADLIYSAITSLDGYVADDSGNFDWAAPELGSRPARHVGGRGRRRGTLTNGRPHLLGNHLARRVRGRRQRQLRLGRPRARQPSCAPRGRTRTTARYVDEWPTSSTRQSPRSTGTWPTTAATSTGPPPSSAAVLRATWADEDDGAVR